MIEVFYGSQIPIIAPLIDPTSYYHDDVIWHISKS